MSDINELREHLFTTLRRTRPSCASWMVRT